MRRLFNWQYEDIAQFLKQHGFVDLGTTKSGGTSHQTFKGFIDNEDRLVDIQFHSGKAIKPKTFKLTIIPQSGIPEKCWLEYAQLPKTKRKKYKYNGERMSKKLFKRLIKRASQPVPKEEGK